MLRSIRFPYAQQGLPISIGFRHGYGPQFSQFAKAHRTKKGDSEWHVFSINGNGFAIFPRDGGHPVALFHVEPDDRDVSICWDPSALHDFWPELNARKHTTVWDAEVAHDWFARLLQHAVAWSQGWREPGTGIPSRRPVSPLARA